MLVAAGPRAISKISLAVVPLWYGLLIALAIRACMDGQPLVGDIAAASLEYETIDYGSCPGAEGAGGGRGAAQDRGGDAEQREDSWTARMPLSRRRETQRVARIGGGNLLKMSGSTLLRRPSMKKIEAFFDNKDKMKENREEVKEADNNDGDNYSSNVAHKPSFSNEYGSAVAKLPIIIYCPGSCSPGPRYQVSQLRPPGFIIHHPALCSL